MKRYCTDQSVQMLYIYWYVESQLSFSGTIRLLLHSEEAITCIFVYTTLLFCMV